MQRAVSIVWNFSAVSMHGQGGEPPRASILSVYASKSSLPGDCHVAALLAMTVALRLFAWFIIRVRVSSFLLRGISQLMPLNDNSVRNLLSLPPRGKAFYPFLFYNVISTGVRVLPERSREIPHSRGMCSCAQVSLPFREIATSLRSSQ